jgi:hypothetical protein
MNYREWVKSRAAGEVEKASGYEQQKEESAPVVKYGKIKTRTQRNADKWQKIHNQQWQPIDDYRQEVAEKAAARKAKREAKPIDPEVSAWTNYIQDVKAQTVGDVIAPVEIEMKTVYGGRVHRGSPVPMTVDAVCPSQIDKDRKSVWRDTPRVKG